MGEGTAFSVNDTLAFGHSLAKKELNLGDVNILRY